MRGVIDPDAFGQCDAVHLRHLPVQQQQVVGRLAPLAVRQGCQGVGPTGHGLGGQTHAAQHIRQHLARRFVVVHHQGTLAMQVGAQHPGRGGGVRALGQSNGEPEGAALARGALDPDRAAHPAGPLFGDGQAQAGAAVLAGGGAVGLLKAFEQLGHLCRRQPDARVSHRETQQHVLVSVLLQLRLDSDLSAAGELDGVVGVVHQHLVQPQRVAHQSFGNARVDVDDQLQPLVCHLVGDQGGDIVQKLLETELDLFEVELAGLDLGVVQDVVDDAQQVLARRLDLLEVVALMLAEVGFQHQVGHADARTKLRHSVQSVRGRSRKTVSAGSQAGSTPPARQLGPAEHRLWCYGEAGVPGIGWVCAAQQLEADFARASAHFATAAASSAGMKLRPVLS